MKAVFRACVASSFLAAFFAVGEAKACDPTKPMPWKLVAPQAAPSDPTKPIPWHHDCDPTKPIPWK